MGVIDKTYLEDGDQGPKKGIKIFAVALHHIVNWVMLAKLASKQVHAKYAIKERRRTLIELK